MNTAPSYIKLKHPWNFVSVGVPGTNPPGYQGPAVFYLQSMLQQCFPNISKAFILVPVSSSRTSFSKGAPSGPH